MECVLAVGEVKSDVSSAKELNEHLDKLSMVKKLREEIQDPAPYRSHLKHAFAPQINPYDQMFTFLICNRLKFIPDASHISYSASTEPRNRHNAVISIEDGGFFYHTELGISNIYYPTIGATVHEHKWVNSNNKSIPPQFLIFLAGYYNSMNLVTLLEPDMAIYLSDDLDKVKKS